MQPSGSKAWKVWKIYQTKFNTWHTWLLLIVTQCPVFTNSYSVQCSIRTWLLFALLAGCTRQVVYVVDYLTRWFDCLETMQYNICIWCNGQHQGLRNTIPVMYSTFLIKWNFLQVNQSIKLYGLFYIAKKKPWTWIIQVRLLHVYLWF